MTSNSRLLLLLCLFTLFSYSLQDACNSTKIDCGEGKCVPDLILPDLFYHCECNPGWKTIMVGPMPVGSCIIPNLVDLCTTKGTVDFSCGGKNPPTPPFPPFNLTSPCNLVWCGDGDCVVNATGTGHYCQCHERAANLFHNPELICMQQCYLDGDCARLGLLPPPPPSSMASPGGGKTGGKTGKNSASYSLTKLPPVLIAIFIAMFLSST